MDYQIGELSKLLHVSKEMIRYYKKKGIIDSKRNEENNYRIYDIWEVFKFIEMMQYQEMGISAKETVQIKKDHYLNNLKRNLIRYEEQLKCQAEYVLLSQDRVKELIERTQCCKMNENNFWVRKISKQYRFHLVSSKNEQYKEIDMQEDISKALFSSNVISFIDPLVVFGKEQEWFYILDERYEKCLSQDILDKAEIQEEQYCLCSVIDMGKMGDFSEECLSEMKKYIDEKKYIQQGKPTGIILGRGYEEERFARYMEIRVPVQYV